LKYKDICREKERDGGKLYNINQKKARVGLFISDRAHFSGRKVIRDKEKHYIW
jgi:hypothetical protein